MIHEHDATHGDLFCPQFICDWCGQQIQSARGGSFAWDMRVMDGPIYHFHAVGGCHTEWGRAQTGDHLWGWDHLDHLVDQLGEGIGYRPTASAPLAPALAPRVHRAMHPRRVVAREPIPKMLRWFLIEKFDYTCQYCGRRNHSSSVGPDGKPWYIDHVDPLSRGGEDGPENFTLACSTCNLRKHTRRPGEYTP